MNNELYEVGSYIDDEFYCFAICTDIAYAERAMKLLEREQDFEEILIKKSNLTLNSITIDGVTFDLTITQEEPK